MQNLTDVPTYDALSAMLTPALFMTATGSLIISTSNRVSRIVDGIRTVNDAMDKLDRGVTDLDFLDERRKHSNTLLQSLEWRSDRIRISLTLLYLAMSAFVGTSLILAFDVVLGSRLVMAPTFLAMIGVGFLLVASINLTREAHRGLRSNRQEVGFYRELRAKRQAERDHRAHAELEREVDR